MGITDDYKRWLVETAYAKLVQYCMVTKEAVLTTGDSIREDRSADKMDGVEVDSADSTRDRHDDR